jgi:ABC-type glutathione transport system ATPase component
MNWPAGNPAPGSPLLSVRLSAGYGSCRDALRGVEFEVRAEEILGLVGQSGSGKSTIALALMRLLDFKGGKARGEVRFDGRDLLALPEREMRAIRGRDISLVPQSPLSALNPSLSIGAQFSEAWRAHAESGGEKDRVADLLAAVQLPVDPSFLRRRPSQLSVGQAQRVLIAMALLHQPRLLIADEPTAALDPITQSEVLELFGQLNRHFRMAILYVSHDLLSVSRLCHRMAVLHDGAIVQTGPPRQVLQQPAHPYTRRLAAALPELSEASTAFSDELLRMAGQVAGPGVPGETDPIEFPAALPVKPSAT